MLRIDLWILDDRFFGTFITPENSPKNSGRDGSCIVKLRLGPTNLNITTSEVSVLRNVFKLLTEREMFKVEVEMLRSGELQSK